jgi:DNA-binding NtrC family response regulator
MSLLMSHTWPGNVRELENAMERAFIMESTDVLQESSFDLHTSSSGMMIPGIPAADPANQVSSASMNSAPAFADEIAASRATNQPPSGIAPCSQETRVIDELNYPAMRDRFEREFIIKALKAYKGRINQTAEATQMTKVTLLRKLEKYGIDAKDYFKL